MKALKYSEILAENRRLGATAEGKPYRIAVLSNVVVNQLGEILEFTLRRRGVRAEVTHGDYANFVQDSVRFKDMDAVIMFWEAANLVEGLHAGAEAMTEGELAALTGRVEQEMELALGNLRDVPLILFNRFTALLFTQAELRNGALQRLCGRLNAKLNALISPHHVIVNIEKVLAIVGLASAADFRQYQAAKALYTVDFFKAYAEHAAPAVFALTGRARKVLVLDCDNTLWGGILGEEGAGQIQMNDATRPGRIFREVQQFIKGLRKQGVLLALCSKNNPEEVDDVLLTHTDMVLKDTDFVAKKVNWKDKAENLRQMAIELNLGLDSFVFVDDSPFEIGLVEDELPQVACFRVPDTLSEYPAVIRSVAREFFVLTHTAEDLLRTEMYRKDVARTETKARFASLEEYLRSLGLTIRIAWNESVSMARAAQLTQKTNQFNLTTRRYSEGDLTGMLTGGSVAVATFSVSDQYGEYGITGLVIVRIGARREVAEIDTFLMSCRVIGRNIERVFFDCLVARLRKMGVEWLVAEYLQTPKNEQVSALYDSLGFDKTLVESGSKKYRLTLSDYRNSGIDYIEVVESVG